MPSDDISKVPIEDKAIYLVRQDMDDFNEAINDAEEMLNEVVLEFVAEGMHPCIMIGILNRIAYGLGFDIEAD